MRSKNNLITIMIIIGVVLLAIIIINIKPKEIDEEITKCIGEKSELYTQLGCHACKTQEEIFGESYSNLNVIDCFYEQEKCIDKKITATPTWIINNEKYIGVQSLESLKSLTGC